MRSRLPSCTLTCTRSVSPGSKRGTGRSACTLSIVVWPTISRMFIASILSSLLFSFRRGPAPGPQIGPPPPRNLLSFLHSPLGDLAVVTRDQDLRHVPFDPVGSGPRSGPGVVRIVQQSALETLLARRRRLAHHPGQQPYAASQHRHGRDPAAPKPVIADRQ